MLPKFFTSDYYRMTGKRWSARGIINLMAMHNLRFAYWYRNNREKKSFLARYKLYRLSRKYGLEISREAEIGEGLYLGHPYNITVGGGVVTGKNVNLCKGCTIGRENRGKREGVPVLGNNVFVGINATVVGKISIGDDVLIAPNAFVNFDVPSHSIVIGNPGKIISRENATNGYIGFLV